MQEQDVAGVKMEGEDGGLSYRRKYKEIKQKVKYLAYEHECFQHDLQKAQEKLLQLAKDKNCLLDQLLRYEAVMLSDDEEQTDYSTDEEEEADTPFFNPQRTELNSRSLHSNNLKASPKSSQPKQGAVKPSQASSPKVTETPKLGTKRQQKSGAVGGGGSSSSSHLSTAAKIAKTVAKAHTTTSVPKQAQPLPQPGSLVVSLPLGQLTPKVKQQQATLPPPPPLTQPPALDLVLPPPPPLSSHVGDSHKPASSSSSSSSSSDSDSSSGSSSSSDEAGDQTSGPVPIMSGVHSNMVATKGAGQLVRPKALTSPNNAGPPPKLIFIGDTPALLRSSPPPQLQLQLQQPGVFTWSNRQLTPAESSPAAGPPGFTPILPTLSSPTFNKPSPGSAFHVVSPKCDSKPSSIAL